jgi:uncharacterized membrane protein
MSFNAKRLVRLGVGSEEMSRTDTKHDDCPIEVHEKAVNVHERRDEQPINFNSNQMSDINVRGVSGK